MFNERISKDPQKKFKKLPLNCPIYLYFIKNIYFKVLKLLTL